jgi:phosphopantothenoylcysteine decarboxylase / phosphopantothenate---cysteine ligase
MTQMLAPPSPSILQGSRIILGVTGGVAAYKAALLARELVRAGALVDTVLTQAASQFVGPPTFSALTGRAVWQDAWDSRVANTMPHIELSRGAAAIVIAPATADFLAKLVHGIADDLLTTLCAARPREVTPLLVAPAMNREMWENPANLRNVAQLRHDAVHILGPGEGDQACGETGIGRMWEPDAIVEGVVAALTPKVLAGVRVLMTAGPTEEPIDPVRVLTNRSSGQMGFALARAMAAMGAQVTMVAGPTPLATPLGVTRINVATAGQMDDAVQANLADIDIFVGVAAVADYTVRHTSANKIKKSDAALAIELVPTRDILRTVAASDKAPFCVGFAAETERVIEYARGKRAAKRLAMIVANHAQAAIGASTNAVTILSDAGETTIPSAPKSQVAVAIAQAIAQQFHAARAAKG